MQNLQNREFDLLHVADQGNHRVRKISAGIINTVAGNGVNDYTGDGGSSTDATLMFPFAVVTDGAGNLISRITPAMLFV